METIGLLMETIGLRTLSFFSRTIRVSRTNATVSRRYEQGRVLPPTSVVFPTAGEQPAALPPADATSIRMIDDAGTTMADCSVLGTLPLFLWHDATSTPEDTGTTRSRRGVMSHLPWKQLVLLFGSVGSDIRRV